MEIIEIHFLITSNAPSQLYNLLQEYYHNTNVTSADTPHTYHTLKGPRAGMPIADIFFNYAMSRMLITCNFRSKTKALITLTDATWLRNFSHPTPVSLLGLMTLSSWSTRTTITLYCPHYKHMFKQSTLSSPRMASKLTTNQAKLKQSLYYEVRTQKTSIDESCRKTPPRFPSLSHRWQQKRTRSRGPNQSLHIHLWKTSHPYPSKQTTIHSTKNDIRIVCSFVYSKLLYNSHTWHPISKKTITKLQHFHINTQRHLHNKITKNKQGEHHAHHSALTHATVPSIQDQIAVQRLLFMRRFVLYAPTELHRFIQAQHKITPDTSFFNTFMQELKRAQQFCTHKPLTDCPFEPHMPALISFFSSFPYQRALQTYKRNITMHLQRHRSYHNFLHEFQKLLPRAGLKVSRLHVITSSEHTIDSQQSHTPDAPDATHTCPQCNYTSPTSQQLLAHMWRKHQKISIAHKYALHALCHHCHKFFHTR